MALATALLAAAAVSVPVPSTADEVAYAAGRVLWTQRERGQVTVTQTRLDGAPPTVVSLPGTSGETWLAANATGFVVTLRTERVDRVVLGGYDGSLRTVLECPADLEVPQDLFAVAGATGFAVGGARCREGQVWTIAPDGTARPAGVTGHDLAYAEPYLAAVDDDRVSVLNLADGSRRTLRDFTVRALAVLHDGSLVVGSGSETPPGIYIWPHGVREPQLVTTSVPVGPLLAAAPGAILYEPQDLVRGRAALALTGLGATGITPVGVPGAGGPREPIAFDGPTAAFEAHSCEGVHQVTIVGPGGRVPGAVDGCPVRLLRGDIHFDRRGRATLRVVCPNGCRTSLRFVREPAPGSGCVEGTNLCPLMAEARLRLPARQDAQHVRVRLTRALRGRRVRVFAQLASGAFPGPELAGFPTRTLVP
jgi:hypothetical protein